jgi:hypothetical protein
MNHGVGLVQAIENSKKIFQTGVMETSIKEECTFTPSCPECVPDYKMHLIHTKESKSGLAWHCNNCNEDFEIMVD